MATVTHVSSVDNLTFAQSAEILAKLVKRYGSGSDTFASVFASEHSQLVVKATRYDSHPLYGGSGSTETVTNLEHMLQPDRPLYANVGNLAITMAQLQWSAEKVQPERDLNDWRALTNSEHYMVEYVLGFFTFSDQLVNANLSRHFIERLPRAEHQAFLQQQMLDEAVHSQVYVNLLRAYVGSSVIGGERTRYEDLLYAYRTLPGVAAKVEWARGYMADPLVPFGERVVAQVALEGILFAVSFAVILFFQQRNLMSEMVQANTWIRRDESVHARFFIDVWCSMTDRPSIGCTVAILREALDHELAFIDEMMSSSNAHDAVESERRDCVVGLPVEHLRRHARYVANMWWGEMVTGLRKLGEVVEPAYCELVPNASTTPLAFMLTNELVKKTDFFQNMASAYRNADTDVDMGAVLNNADDEDY